MENEILIINKTAIDLLPTDREYTELEALISYQYDISENRFLNPYEYSRKWRWSRNRVREFITDKNRYLANMKSLFNHMNNKDLSIPESPSKPENDKKTILSSGQKPKKSLHNIVDNIPLNPIEKPKKSLRKCLEIEEYLTYCENAFEKIGQKRMFEPLKSFLIEFFDYRRDVIRQPLKSEIGITKMIISLAEGSNLDYKVAQAMINQTIASEKWVGIFPVHNFQGMNQQGKPIVNGYFKPRHGDVCPYDKKVILKVYENGSFQTENGAVFHRDDKKDAWYQEIEGERVYAHV